MHHLGTCKGIVAQYPTCMVQVHNSTSIAVVAGNGLFLCLNKTADDLVPQQCLLVASNEGKGTMCFDCTSATCGGSIQHSRHSTPIAAVAGYQSPDGIPDGYGFKGDSVVQMCPS